MGVIVDAEYEDEYFEELEMIEGLPSGEYGAIGALLSRARNDCA